VLSSRYRPGPYSTLEAATDRFVRWYLNRLLAKSWDSGLRVPAVAEAV